MIQFRLYFDKDAETEWLNRMAADGWAMKGFFAGFFRFEECEKGEYVYQVDFGSRMNAVSDDYREFMQEAGIEIVQTWGYWVILRRKASEGAFELYTDAASGMAYYKKIRRMFKVVTIVEMLGLFVNLYFGFVEKVSMGFVGVFVIGAILVGCINALARLNEKIRELQERIDGIAGEGRPRTISMLLAVGLLLNSCSLLIGEAVPAYVRHIVQVLAVILMFGGLFGTWRGRKKL